MKEISITKKLRISFLIDELDSLLNGLIKKEFYYNAVEMINAASIILEKHMDKIAEIKSIHDKNCECIGSEEN